MLTQLKHIILAGIHLRSSDWRNQDLLRFVKILAAGLGFGSFLGVVMGCVPFLMGVWGVWGVWTWGDPQVQRLSRILSVVFFGCSIGETVIPCHPLVNHPCPYLLRHRAIDWRAHLKTRANTMVLVGSWQLLCVGYTIYMYYHHIPISHELPSNTLGNQLSVCEASDAQVTQSSFWEKVTEVRRGFLSVELIQFFRYRWIHSLVGGLEHFLFSHILRIIIPTD